MIRGWAIAVLAAGCGRVGFDRATPDGSGDVANIEDAPGSLIDDVFTAGETTSLVIDRGAVGSYYDATGTMLPSISRVRIQRSSSAGKRETSAQRKGAARRAS